MRKAEAPLWAPGERARGLWRPRSLAAAARFPAGFPEAQPLRRSRLKVPRAICTIRCEEAKGRRSALFASLPLLRPSGNGDGSGGGGTRKRASARSFAPRRRPDRIFILLPRQIPTGAPELLPCSAFPRQETCEGPGAFLLTAQAARRQSFSSAAWGQLGPPAGGETRKRLYLSAAQEDSRPGTTLTRRLPPFRPKIIRTSSNDQARPGI